MLRLYVPVGQFGKDSARRGEPCQASAWAMRMCLFLLNPKQIASLPSRFSPLSAVRRQELKIVSSLLATERKGKKIFRT